MAQQGTPRGNEDLVHQVERLSRRLDQLQSRVEAMAEAAASICLPFVEAGIPV